MLNRLGCSACPLNDAAVRTPKMQPTLARRTDVYFLAEAPGRHEDETSHRPLTGPSGKLLRSCIPEGMEANCSFDNVVRDRPPGNRTPTWNEIECCRQHVVKSIEQAKPKLIVGLGAVPTSWVLSSGDMAGMRGRLFAVRIGTHQCWFLPTYHPSFILRTAYEKSKPLQSRLGYCFKTDLKRAFQFAEELTPPQVESVSSIRDNLQCFAGGVASDFTDSKTLLQKAKRAKIKAIDLETSCLRPFAADATLLTVAISFDQTNFAFALDHPSAGWTPAQREALLVELADLLLDDTIKIAHNAPFELEWLIALFDHSIVNHTAWADTMVQAHVLDERKGARRDDDGPSRYQGLEFLLKQHFGIHAYKSLFKVNRKDMIKSDLAEMLTYNACDAKYELRLYHAQYRLLEKMGLLDVYFEAEPRQPTVALMQSLGVPVDQKEIKLLQKKLGAEISAIEFNIADLSVVKTFVADHKEFNPLSTEHALTLFRDYLKRPEVTAPRPQTKALDFDKSPKSKKVYREEGPPQQSVDKNVLDQIDHPLSQLIIQLRNKTKMKSTYVDPLSANGGKILYADGKLHTNFNTTATETGRLSSTGPNLQNYPHRTDEWVRRPIIPPPNHLILAADYGQLEACTGAMCSKDRYLVDALWKDYDIHMVWAKRLVELVPVLVDDPSDKKKMGKFRSLVKNKLVFPAFFGAANESVCDYLTAGTGHEMEPRIVDKVMDEFWSTFSEMRRWQDKLMVRYYDIGYVETLMGRRHNYPLTRNQAINMPVQGTAAELVLDAMVRLSHMAATTNQWHLHPILNIHDDLSFFVPDDDDVLEEAIRIITHEMLTFSFPWINVPLSVTLSIGSNWSDMTEFDKFWSHKDV